MYKQDNVTIKNGTIICNQAQGRPGIYYKFHCVPNAKYLITLIDFKKNQGNPFLWVADNNKKTILNTSINNTKINYSNKKYFNIFVGIIFQNPKKNHNFRLTKIILSKIGNFPTQQKKDQPKIVQQKKDQPKMVQQKKDQPKMVQPKIDSTKNAEPIQQITLNEIFDKIYVINLERNQERLNKVNKSLLYFDINYERFNAIDGQTMKNEFNAIFKKKWSNWEKKYTDKFKMKRIGEYGCLLSHREIIKDAKKQNYKKILIFEDDILVHKNIKELVTQYKTIFNQKWKLCYLGATQHGWGGIRFNRNYYNANSTDGAFAYGIDQSIYDEILNLIANPKFPIDAYYRYFQNKYFCPVIFENLFIADVSESDLRGKRNLNQLAKKVRWNVEKYYMI